MYAWFVGQGMDLGLCETVHSPHAPSPHTYTPPHTPTHTHPPLTHTPYHTLPSHTTTPPPHPHTATTTHTHTHTPHTPHTCLSGFTLAVLARGRCRLSDFRTRRMMTLFSTTGTRHVAWRATRWPSSMPHSSNIAAVLVSGIVAAFSDVWAALRAHATHCASGQPSRLIPAWRLATYRHGTSLRLRFTTIWAFCRNRPTSLLTPAASASCPVPDNHHNLPTRVPHNFDATVLPALHYRYALAFALLVVLSSAGRRLNMW